MNKNEAGTIITTLREADHALFLVMGHLDEMRTRTDDYQTLETTATYIRDSAAAIAAAISYLQGVLLTLKK